MRIISQSLRGQTNVQHLEPDITNLQNLHKPTEFTLFNRLHFVLNNIANIDNLWRYLLTIFTFSHELFTLALNMIHRSEQFHNFCSYYLWQFHIRPPKNTFVLLVFQFNYITLNNTEHYSQLNHTFWCKFCLNFLEAQE